MNTKQLHYILAIAEEGGLTAAAEKLHITQPALSKYLAELEEELGTELFFQHKNVTTLPPPAKSIWMPHPASSP